MITDEILGIGQFLCEAERLKNVCRYEFNIGYARKFTDAVPLVAEIRKSIDQETRQNALRGKGTNRS